MRRVGFHIMGLAFLLMISSCSEYSRIEKSKDYSKKLEFANRMFQEKKYTLANSLYEELLTIYKGTVQFEDLYYKYAYSAYDMGDYTQAAFLFKNFVDYFPNSSRASEMDYMQAYCFYKLSPRAELDQSNTQKAIGSMQEFINEYPESDRVADANKIIDACRMKLERKDYKSAILYYNLGYYNAARIYFRNLMLDYPDSNLGEEYKYMIIKSEYQYALNSIPSKQEERYDQVITDYLDFLDHYPKSKYTQEAQSYYDHARKFIKSLQNDQNKKKPD